MMMRPAGRLATIRRLLQVVPSVLVIAVAQAIALASEARPIKVIASEPKPNEVVDGGLVIFSLQLDVPVDHRRSTILLRDSTGVRELKPRLNSAPQFLFYLPGHLAPGAYELTWRAQTPSGPGVNLRVPFSIK